MHQLIDIEDLTIRLARAADQGVVVRLAQRDSRRPPAYPLLLGFSGDRLMAAQSLADGQLVADPFEPTDGIVEVLGARAEQLGGPAGRGLFGRLRRRRPVAQPLPQPAGHPAPELFAG
jgi:hypothetical protein